MAVVPGSFVSLQASWLTDVVLQSIEKDLLQNDLAAAFRIGHDYSQPHMCHNAMKVMVWRSRKEILKLLVYSSGASMSDQTVYIQAIALSRGLSEV